MNFTLDDLFSSQGGAPLTANEVLLSLVLAFVLGQLVAWVYMWTHRGVSYSRSTVQSLVMLSLIVTAVMLVVGNNMARAFGLFGALALIRFRTPIKDTRDTAFLFLAVGIGIAVGSGNWLVAVMATGFALLVAIYMALSRFGERLNSDGVLRFVMPALREQEAALRQVLKHYCRTSSLLHLRDADSEASSMEFAYQLRLHDQSQSTGLVADMRAIPGVTTVSLLLQDEDEEL